MNYNINLPLNSNFSDLKIGESGPVNWYEGARCYKPKVQFSESIWNPQKVEIKQRVEMELVQARMNLGLWRISNRMWMTSIPVYILMFTALIIYIFAINDAVQDDISDKITTIIILYFVTILILLSIYMTIICYFMSQSQKKVDATIFYLNQKLNREGLNIYITAKRKFKFPTATNFVSFQAYERVYN